ncbi:flagellar basal body rod protein FlgB [Hyphobacterium indicum]|jgi:flagellar basal-body rod protein FlgB|uniref:flagellar basal body rod protein FlgB n=1 Tax=Hyphobacterium indicum TaxID=2162714 RepID=UPI000D6504F2|nr:flagellar basal body protein [Hyphobacterium indicum]MBI1237160.1 flagellar basal body rod protein [Alphaproteobacteria bacterium]|tara:strand:- start:178 stop:555 length:378 start_codon:yes stop_codon:yes gene_type:complete
MSLDNAPTLAILRESMAFHSQRHDLLTQNIANANTPGYTPQDLSRADFHRALQEQLRNSASVSAADRRYTAQDRPDSQTTVNGNSVILEEQMVRAQENRMQYETALTLYQKSLGLMRMAARPVGG